ncbi:MAG TPA: hypothetical protein IAB21_02675 [Candidatus Avelusimicrobium excrementipullorum]|nr:hypothetical protein [Candidatus Avelusimicrobium excrementipullorum]
MVLTVLTEKEIFGTGGGIVNFFDVFSKEEGPKNNIGCKKECSFFCTLTWKRDKYASHTDFFAGGKWGMKKYEFLLCHITRTWQSLCRRVRKPGPTLFAGELTSAGRFRACLKGRNMRGV